MAITITCDEYGQLKDPLNGIAFSRILAITPTDYRYAVIKNRVYVVTGSYPALAKNISAGAFVHYV